MKGHALPGIEYASVGVDVTSGSSSSSLNIHPNGDNSKCVGILGGTYANGAAVDMYGALPIYLTRIDRQSSFDCNGSDTQMWKWNDESLTSVNPVDGFQWCLDAGVQSQCMHFFLPCPFPRSHCDINRGQWCQDENLAMLF